MADSPHHTEHGDESDRAPTTGSPRWMKVLGITVIAVVVLLAIVLLAGGGLGGHGPGIHTP